MGLDRDLIEEVSCVIADHHQKRGGAEFLPSAYQKEYETIQDILNMELLEAFGPVRFPDGCSDWSAFCEALEGLIFLSDWLSSDSFFNPNGSWDSCTSEYISHAYKCAEEAIESIGFTGHKFPGGISLSDFYGWSEDSLRPMQILVNSITGENPVFVIIEDSPGAGKTESAVFLAACMANACGKEGMYFALPTAATSNQMWTRLNDVFKKNDADGYRLRLLHGMAWSVMSDERGISHYVNGSEGMIGEEWLKPSRKALLSQFSVGTVDQVMMAALNIRFRQLRMLGLTNKVLVIDEVHAYDAYMSSILDRLLEWCRTMRIPVILLSATLPEKKKKDFMVSYTGSGNCITCSTEYPLVTYVTEDGAIHEKNSIPFRESVYGIRTLSILNNLEEMADRALALIEEGGNLCLMVNTVADAQQIYKILEKKNIPDRETELMLYHARFKACDRRKIEEACLQKYSRNGMRPFRSILVCTQVVEQSLDVDFDILMTQICPIDLLIQRMGREWRHSLERPHNIKSPMVYVVTGDITKSAMKYIYEPYIIHRTEEYLKSKNEIHVPGDLRNAISFVYEADDTDSEEYYCKYFNDSLMETKAEGCEIPPPDPGEYYLMDTEDVFENDDCHDSIPVATRLGQPSARIILCSQDLLDSYRTCPHARQVQNEMLDNSLSVNVNIPFEQCEHDGALKGMYIAAGTDNYDITGKVCISYDSVYGAIISHRGK